MYISEDNMSNNKVLYIKSKKLKKKNWVNNKNVFLLYKIKWREKPHGYSYKVQIR